MKKKYILLTYILTIFLIGWGQSNTEIPNLKNILNIYGYDTSIVAVLPFDNSSYLGFDGNIPTELTNEDHLKIEAILNKCVNDYNTKTERDYKNRLPEFQLSKENFIIDFNRYKRQYVATINSKGEKVVWINCFCKSPEFNWKRNIIFFRDGGNCFFNLKINLTKGDYYDLSVNGEA